MTGGSYVYFVHSFFPQPEDGAIVATRTTYGETFASSVWREVASAVVGLAAGLLVWFGLSAWVGWPAEPASPVEREVSRSLTFLEDVDLLDEVALLETMERLHAEPAPGQEADRG